MFSLSFDEPLNLCVERDDVDKFQDSEKVRWDVTAFLASDHPPSPRHQSRMIVIFPASEALPAKTKHLTAVSTPSNATINSLTRELGCASSGLTGDYNDR